MIGRLAAITMAVAAFGGTASSQTWPEHSLRLVVPFPAGGPTDLIARSLAQSLGERLGQTVIVENRGGAGGVTGTDMVSKSAPDGYTMALTSAGALAIAPSLQKMPYVALRDLKPVTLVAKVPELLVVPKGSGIMSLADLIAAAKAKPGDFNFASTGTGSMSHLSSEMLKGYARLDIVHVPYTGAAPALNDLLPGRVQMFFGDMQILLPQVSAGVLQPLAIGHDERVKLLPDVPTLSESGFPGAVAENWYGIVVPAATPPAVFEKLRAALVDSIHDPVMQSRLSAAGAILVGDTPEAFATYIEAETKKWGEIVRISGAKAD